MKYGIVYLHKIYRGHFKKPSASIEINQLWLYLFNHHNNDMHIQ